MFVLETERLYLRELTIADANSFFQLNLNEEVLRYTGDVPFKNIEEAELFLKNYNQYKKYGLGRWAVMDKESNLFLGWCGIKYTEKLNEYDIGFRFFREYWNQGYATEAAKASVHYGFTGLGISTIIGRVMKANQPSIRVLEKIGFQYKRDFNFDGSEGMIYMDSMKNV